MKSRFYYDGHHQAVATSIRDHLNSISDFLTPQTANSPRAVLMLISYSIQGTSLTASDIIFAPIEFLDWDCLTVGALGWGQIQIANANEVRVRHRYSRKRWMLQLCDAMMEFYPREIDKIRSRMDRFVNVRAYWESKQDVWE